MSSVAQPSSVSNGSFDSFLNGNSGAAISPGYSFNTLAASLATAAASFGAQVLAFYILRWRMTRIYRPKTYMVAERQRVPIPPSGPWQWIKPMLSMPNSTIISKCGLDAYFFLRYLRMLLKIFVPMAVVILPILLPINHYSGDPTRGVTGVDTYGWPNLAPKYQNRLWAHLILAIGVILWFCYVVYQELRGYIRIRQAYLTSPQHRIRASATTVLVSGIPRKWLTLEALNGLYDVYPGGIRNIWINRDFDELGDKVTIRDKIAKQLEDAETVLIKLCVKKNKEALAKKAKEQGQKTTKAEKKQKGKQEDLAAEQMAQGNGFSSGDPNQTPANPQDAVEDIQQAEQDRQEEHEEQGLDLKNPLKLVGQGFGALGHGIAALGQKTKNAVTDVADDINGGVKATNNAIDAVNTGGGFIMEDSTEALSNSNQDPGTGYPSIQEKIAAIKTRSASPSKSKAPGLRKVEDDGPQGAPRQSPPRHIDINVEPPSAGPKTGGSTGDASADRGGASLDQLRPQAQPEPAVQSGHLRAIAAKIGVKAKEPALPFPSPQPHTSAEENPLDTLGQGHNDLATNPQQRMAKSKWAEALSKTQFWRKRHGGEVDIPTEYPDAFNLEYAEDNDGEPEWKKYIEVKDRETIRLPVVKQSWFPSLPFVGEKVDRIYWLRKELARLNAEIETDQDDVEKYPFMNSAFIQFNHQIAAHMACQSVSHHIPQHMAPRLVEISPTDIIWSNMSIKWWERYVRTGLVVVACIGLIILFAVPVSFTGALSRIDDLSNSIHWLKWLAKLPTTVKSIIQGILPPLLLAILLAIVPLIFRFLVKQQGVATGNDRELGVQRYYFLFLFIQVFLIVTISTGLSKFLTTVANNPTSIVSSLAKDLPSASGYFFSYMIIQALGNSASNILQTGTLLMWFLLGPLFDSTARAKWRRQTSLTTIQWGSYFPPFTNFAVIGLVFSIISPFILIFNLITFTLFWVVQRYNVIYVYIFVNDTGGLLFPEAVNQLFAGLYVMELCLIGLFFLFRDVNNNLATIPQAVIMIVAMIFTVLYQVLLNQAFAPLLRYLPITLEDEAVERDEEFARAQDARWRGLTEEEGGHKGSSDGSEDIEDRLESRERREEEADRAAEDADKQRARAHRSSRSRSHSHNRHLNGNIQETRPSKRPSWKTAVTKSARNAATAPANTLRMFTQPRGRRTTPAPATTVTQQQERSANGYSVAPNGDHIREKDLEGQKLAGDVLFSGFSDELEDLTVEERDTLVRYSFQHSALRARRPVIWIPRDPLGVSDDEIARSKLMSTIEVGDSEGEKGEGEGESRTWIWMSNEGTGLDSKGRVVFKRSPPDFASVDLIAL